jgi:hypothetical protein
MLRHECRHAWLVPDRMRFPGERGQGERRQRPSREPPRGTDNDAGASSIAALLEADYRLRTSLSRHSPRKAA